MKVQLGDIFTISSGGTPNKNENCYYDNGTIPWVKTGDLKEKYISRNVSYITELGLKNSSAKLFPVDTVLVAMYGATIGACSILPFEASTNQACAAFLPNEKVLPEYLYYFLYANKENFIKDGVGGAQPNISAGYLKKVAFELKSISEQSKIVDILDKVKSIIDNRKQQLQQLDDLVKARFVELMQTYPSNNLLEEFISAYKAERCGDREIPVLSITKEDGIVFQSEKFKKRIASVDTSTYKVVPRGKLVQGIHIDERNFAIQNIADEGIVSPAYKIWNVNEDKAIPEVLAYAMRTDRTMAYISSKFTGSVKRRESISMNDFMTTPIDLPSIKVQTEFYNFMKQTDKSKFVVQKALDEAQLLFDNLMQEYFG